MIIYFSPKLKSTIVLLWFISFHFLFYAQTKDSVLVITTYTHQIENNKIKDESYVENQVTCDIRGLLIRDLHFSKETGQIISYQFMWYKKDLLVRDETFNGKNKLTGLKKYDYNNYNDLIKKSIYVDADTLQADTLILFKYNSEKKLVRKTITIPGSGKLVQQKYKYDESGRIISQVTKGNISGYYPHTVFYKYSIAPEGYINIIMEIKPENQAGSEHIILNPSGKIVQKTTYTSQDEVQQIIYYEYDTNENLKKIKTTNQNQEIIDFKRIERNLKIMDLGINKNYNSQD